MRQLLLCLAALLSPICQGGSPPPFTGHLTLATDQPLALSVLRDDYKFAGDPALKVAMLPPFSFDYIQDGRYIIPRQRGSISSNHPLWEYILEPGRIDSSTKNPEKRRLRLPFTLQERNANCMHNGMLELALDSSNRVRDAKVSMASETCVYFKFNLSGKLAATFRATETEADSLLVERFRHQRELRLATKPMPVLARKYPGTKLAAFSGGGKIPRSDITIFGYVIDDVHYRSSCQTREHSALLCEEVSLPSYSLAKTLFAALATMRMEKLYPGSKNELLANYIPQCRDKTKWQGVSLLHALDMLTGNFGPDEGRDDEASTATNDGFFVPGSHLQKVSYSCNAWPRRALPGQHWAYHTSDTYLLGSAMNALLRKKRGARADIYRDLVLPLWDSMDLNPAIQVVRRTYDDDKQPFTGYGMTLVSDDIARLATALNRGSFADQLDSKMYSSAMQRMPTPKGSYPVDGPYYYRHGFWAYDAQTLLGCDRPVMVPFMSGYGGINVVMMPNDSIYYIFGDSGKFAFADMLKQSHRIRSMCPDNNNKHAV